MFLVYESRFGELNVGCEPTAILGVYDTKEKAVEVIKNRIKDNKGYGYILDEESTKEIQDITIMFRDYQENWGDYFEIHIEELELNKTM